VPQPATAEHRRLADSEDRRADWKHWGPYLSERAWGTVREDYSLGGNAWTYFPHDHARSRAYRWNEDGLAGFCNRFQNLCLAVALWNGRDPILKERLFGLSGSEGNHGEDVKEYYYYLDGTPTHSYMKMLYKYPQVAYPYALLVEEARRRTRGDPEFELFDAIGDALRAGRYFDVFVEYAKAGQEDILGRVTAVNRGPEPARLHVLPHLWYRNTWSWGYKPRRYDLRAVGPATVHAEHRHLGDRWWSLDTRAAAPELLFTENETNVERLFGVANHGPYVKDAFHEAVVAGRRDRVNPALRGSKAAGHYRATVEPGGSFTVRFRFADARLDDPFADFDGVFARRIAEADEFHAAVQGPGLGDDERRVQRQAVAGLLWSKQCYHYSVELWQKGDPAGPPPPSPRAGGRNGNWGHVYALDVLSMPDKWEYPWFAAWDLAFHCVPLASVDPEWAMRQLVLMLREWYMHPNGQIAAYEWNFGDVNPPVHAWAARRVYEVIRDATGRAEVDFLEEVFHKLLLNFTWWVNRKDADGRNAFQGGFLGLDNIGLFDRSSPPLSDGSRLEQADGTAWMAMFCLEMLAIAVELSRTRPAYEATATKFFEHFLAIAHALNGIGGEVGMWDEADGFFYDVIRSRTRDPEHVRVRSFVGLIPLFATLALGPDVPERLPRFWRRVEWYLKYRPTLTGNACLLTHPGAGGHRLMSIVDRAKLETMLRRMLDPSEFLSDHGLRSLSRRHAAEPFSCLGHTIWYEPAESSVPIYGGNSNWRGPVWFPVNFLMIDALRMAHRYYGDDLRVELPLGSGRRATLDDVAAELSRRLVGLFLRDGSSGGRRPVFGGNATFQSDPHWRDYIPFHEYFHGDDGAGLGASHQTGWTALVADLIARGGRARSAGRDGQAPQHVGWAPPTEPAPTVGRAHPTG
jgi:hypothetical protein